MPRTPAMVTSGVLTTSKIPRRECWLSAYLHRDVGQHFSYSAHFEDSAAQLCRDARAESSSHDALEPVMHHGAARFRYRPSRPW